MEYNRYSPEKALEESEDLKLLIQTKQAGSYSEAAGLFSLISKKERPKGKYQEDAGVKYEYMAVELFNEIPGIQIAFLSSEHEDKIKKVDIILCLSDGGKLALQVSGSESKEEQIKKVDELKKEPMLTELHDDDENVIMKEFIPKGIVSCDKNDWGKAMNEARVRGLPNQTGALVNKPKEIVKLLNHIIVSVNLAKKYRRDHEDIFNARINSLQKILKQIQGDL